MISFGYYDSVHEIAGIRVPCPAIPESMQDAGFKVVPLSLLYRSVVGYLESRSDLPQGSRLTSICFRIGPFNDWSRYWITQSDEEWVCFGRPVFFYDRVDLCGKPLL